MQATRGVASPCRPRACPQRGSRRPNGVQTADDARFNRLRDDLALIQTVDFFTPGGLLVALPGERAAELPGTVVGPLVEGQAGVVSVRG